MTDKDQITTLTLHDGDVSVTLLSLGCVTQDWRVPVANQSVPVVLGYRDPEAYRANPAYLGAIAGRVANRIADARFDLDGVAHVLTPNDGMHHLHGGPKGLSTRIWQMHPDGPRAVRLRYASAHGEGGYPGAVLFDVTITLTGHTLRYDMRARPDRPTPINLAQHNYYALAGRGEVRAQTLTLAADAFTPTTPDLIPTGAIEPLDGGAHDFRTPRTLAQGDPDRAGLDLNYVLRPRFNPGAEPSARLQASNGLTLSLRTDQPGLQVYTATHLDRFAAPLAGQDHAPFCGLCLEPQGFPNAINTPGFPSIIATPDRPYRQVLEVTIAPELPLP